MRGRTRCLLMVIIMSICMLVGCGTETAENATTKSVTQSTVSVSKEQATQSVANTEKVTKEKTTEAVTEKTEAAAPQVEEKQQAVEEPVVSNNSGSSTMVWIPKSGKKYHRSSSCSNMKNPSQVTLEKAQSLGYTPCSKCY
jgi:glucan-binding YG repeat protein